MTTLSTYLSVSKNLTQWQTMAANMPAVKTADAYFKANIGKVTTVSGLVSNLRACSIMR